MMARSLLSVPWLLALACAGCSPNVRDGYYGCTTTVDCPTGFSCSAGRCRIGGGSECRIDANCDDVNPCTLDVCEGGLCSHEPNDGVECDDDNFCNGADTCMGGVCVASGIPPCPRVRSDAGLRLMRRDWRSVLRDGVLGGRVSRRHVRGVWHARRSLLRPAKPVRSRRCVRGRHVCPVRSGRSAVLSGCGVRRGEHVRGERHVHGAGALSGRMRDWDDLPGWRLHGVRRGHAALLWGQLHLAPRMQFDSRPVPATRRVVRSPGRVMLPSRTALHERRHDLQPGRDVRRVRRDGSGLLRWDRL